MTSLIRRSAESRSQLLVSVRNAKEALEALAGGADIIDVKEPSRGPLGAPDRAQVEQVLNCVNAHRPVSVAAGELVEATVINSTRLAGVQWVKFGLANCAHVGNWPARFAHLQTQLPQGTQIVPVVYADFRAAHAPAPEEVLHVTQNCNCPAILVDTFDKSAGTLFEHWTYDSVEKFVTQSHAIGTAIALAGRLREAEVVLAAAAGADVIGVRGAVCDDGRMGKLRRDRVELLLACIRDGSPVTIGA